MSDDLISDLRGMPSSLNEALRTMDRAAARIEALEAENARLREQSLVKDHVIIEAAKLAKKLMTRAVAAESALAEAVEVMRPFTAHYEPWMDRYDPETQSSTFPRHTFAQLNAARAFIQQHSEKGK